jgi:hypothetical protein
MRQVPTDQASEVASSVDRMLDQSVRTGWLAEVITIEPHRNTPGLWTAEAWLTNGAYLSLLGRSEAEVRLRLETALERLTRA